MSELIDSNAENTSYRNAQDMTSKRAEFLLGSGNYYHWEYNMRMTLARKRSFGAC